MIISPYHFVDFDDMIAIYVDENGKEHDIKDYDSRIIIVDAIDSYGEKLGEDWDKLLDLKYEMS